MADKNSVDDWDIIANNNDNVGGIDLSESVMLPSAVNNADRELMAQIKAKFDIVGSIPNAVLEDQKSAGTHGGTSTALTWTTRYLNTKVRDPDGLITLSSNQFTPSVGGWVEFDAPAYAAQNHVVGLYNVTDSVFTKLGSSEYQSTSGPTVTRSFGGCAVVAGKTYELRHKVVGGYASFGFGLSNTFADNVYARLKFWRA